MREADVEAAVSQARRTEAVPAARDGVALHLASEQGARRAARIIAGRDPRDAGLDRPGVRRHDGMDVAVPARDLQAQIEPFPPHRREVTGNRELRVREPEKDVGLGRGREHQALGIAGDPRCEARMMIHVVRLLEVDDVVADELHHLRPWP